MLGRRRGWGLAASLAALGVLLATGSLGVHQSSGRPTELSLGDALGVEGRDLGWAGGSEGEDRGRGRNGREGVVSAEPPQLDNQALSTAISMGLKQAWAGVTGNPGGLTGCNPACMKDMFKRVSRPVTSRFHALAHPWPRATSESAADAASQVDTSSQEGVAAAYRDAGITGLGSQVIPQMMGQLATYAPLAVVAEKKLAAALTKASKWGPKQLDGAARYHSRRGEQSSQGRSQLQFEERVHDPYDAAGQRSIRKFAPEDIPRLLCGEGKHKTRGHVGEIDKMGDCELKGGHEYNRMWYLDRRRSNKVATAAEVHHHMQGVKKLAAGWKHLLVGAGGGSGPGAFDSPYYFCYDQYQEDPEFSACLRDLAESDKEFRIRRWARSSVSEPSQMRVGFPKLRKEWEAELPEAEQPEEATSSEQDKLG